MTRRRPAVRATSVAVAALLAGAVALGAPVGPDAAARPLAPADTPVTVTLDQLTPVSATDGATLVLRGTVRTGAAEADGLELEVGVGDPVTTRSSLTRQLGTSSTPDADADTDAPELTTTLARCDTCLAGGATSVRANGSTTFTVSVPLGDRLDQRVVSAYPLIVRVAGTSGTDVATVLGEADSWLPFFPGKVGSPLRVSWVWPLDPAPVQAADGSISDATFPASLGTSGTLGAQLVATSARGDAPVTYAVEPSLLQAAAQTAQDGWHRTDSATVQPASADATSFLAALRTATDGKGVVALPYGDPDAEALVHANAQLDLTNAISTGASDLQASLPKARVLTGVGWVPGQAVDQPALNAYAGAGTTTLVLPGGQLAVPDDSATPTATAVTTLPTSSLTVRGLVTDPDAEALLATGGRDAPTPAMSAQELLALLAVIVAELPNTETPRDVVLAVPRTADPTSAWTRAVLTATEAAASGAAPWLAAVALGDTATDPSAERQSLAAYPADAASAELPRGVITASGDGVTALRRTVADASSLFSAQAGAELTKPLDLALTRAESFAWRADPGGSDALRSQTADLAAAMTQQVGLATASTVTLASNRTSIPVTVDNGLAHPVTVALSLSSADRTKIAPVSRTVTVPAGKKVRVLMPASVDRAGTFRATVTMSTPSGYEITSNDIAIHSKAYGALTLGITFGAIGVLGLALVVRATRRIRHSRAEARS